MNSEATPQGEDETLPNQSHSLPDQTLLDANDTHESPDDLAISPDLYDVDDVAKPDTCNAPDKSETEKLDKDNTDHTEQVTVEISQDLCEDVVVKLAEDEITKLDISLPVPPTAGMTAPVSEDGELGQLSKSEVELKNLCKNMFSKLEDFLEGEVASSVNEYALLEKMNKATAVKYGNMLNVAKSAVQGIKDVNGKFAGLRQYLEQIDQIEKEVLLLEQSAYKLDGYAKRLEERFRKLEKR